MKTELSTTYGDNGYGRIIIISMTREMIEIVAGDETTGEAMFCRIYATECTVN